MAEPTIELPATVRQKAIGLGPDGVRWLLELPELVAELRRAWSFTVVGEALDGGTAGYVVRARTADGRDAVLKVSVPDHGDRQIKTIAAARGRGYVRLLAYDIERGAMLQEALGPSMTELALPPEETIGRLCTMLAEAWQVPPDPSIEYVNVKADGLGEMVRRFWEELDRPCPERVVARALRYAERRAAAADPDRSVLVHGDPHPANALRVSAPRPGAEAGFVFVDPDGFVDDPTYDLGVVLRDWCTQLLAADDPGALARHYCRLLAEASGHEETAIWEWGYLERVSTALYCSHFGFDELARPYFATAELLVDS